MWSAVAPLLALALAVSMTRPSTAQTPANQPSSTVTFHPGELWPDAQGNHIQAHGGGIIKLKEPDGDTYYWFGEERRQDLPRNQRAVSCYASKDLAHWTFRKDVLTLNASDFQGGLVLERPKVFYNPATKKFVMYFHYDSGNYGLAEVGVAVSDTVDGDYVQKSHFRPLGKESRDIGQFIDDDGTPYLIFEDRPNGWHIAALSDDYLSVVKDVCLIPMHMEGGALVHYNGLYYAIGSHLTGWRANPNLYATAKSLEGPWSEFKDIAPPESNTYGAQSTMLLKVVGTKSTTVIFMGDIWRPSTQWDSRYLWMPLQIGDGKLWLPQPREWSLNLQTGESTVNAAAPAMTLPAPPPPNRGRRGRGNATAPAASAPAPAPR